jgi:hypothetical protein
MLLHFDVDIYGASKGIAVNKGYSETSSFPALPGLGINIL